MSEIMNAISRVIKNSKGPLRDFRTQRQSQKQTKSTTEQSQEKNAKIDLVEKREIYWKGCQKRAAKRLHEQMNKNKQKSEKEQKLKENISEDSKNSYDIYDMSIDEETEEGGAVVENDKSTIEEISNVQILETKVDELYRLNKKQKRKINKLKKKVQRYEAKKENSRSKLVEYACQYMKRVGDAVLKALPKILDTAAKILIGKLFLNANKKLMQKEVMT